MQPRFLIRTCPFRASLLGLALAAIAGPALAQTSPQTFAFTGAAQTFTVPTGVTALTVVANGAQGGGTNGGKGGRVTAVLRVTPSQVLTIYVGGQNGYNGGGAGGGPTPNGAGGGATDIRIGGTSSLSDRVLVAGGGGGAGGVIGGGLGGGLNGGPSPANVPGGSQIGNTLGNGGNGVTTGSGPGSGSGGGGGGYYGGDGGFDFGGGGGGSSYTSPSLTSNVVHTQGANTGNGSLSITYTAPPAAPTNLQRTAGATYSPTDISLQWTDNSTNETNFVLERGKRSSANQLITDNSIVWTAVAPAPAANTTTYRDYSATGLTANLFGYFYRIKAVNSAGSSAYANNSDGALPVTLLFFNGRMTDGGALLAWATAREADNAWFQVERSPDARSFESIGRVTTLAPNGTAQTRLDYTFTDPQPLPGVNYYRLVQTDRDGTRTTSRIVALTRDGQQPVLFPNPVGASGEAVIEPAIRHNGYTLSDVLGRIVQRVDAPGVLSRVSLAGLPAGVYVLRVEQADGVKTWRVLR
jgi:Glycine rich protein